MKRDYSRALKWFGLALVLYIVSKVVGGVIGDSILAVTSIVLVLGVVNLFTVPRKEMKDGVTTHG